jgi:hypothetical protein
MFDAYKVSYCKVCKLLYCVAEGGQCTFTRHREKRVQMKSGKMEEWRTGIDGKRCKWVCFQCCGEVPEEDDGCVEHVEQAHVLDPSREFSVLTITQAPVFEI